MPPPVAFFVFTTNYFYLIFSHSYIIFYDSYKYMIITGILLCGAVRENQIAFSLEL